MVLLNTLLTPLLFLLFSIKQQYEKRDQFSRNKKRMNNFSHSFSLSINVILLTVGKFIFEMSRN